MKKVEKVYVRVKQYLELDVYEKCAQLYALVHQGWMMTSNITQCINSTLVAARELHIFDFLEQVRLIFARWNCTNRKNASFIFTLLGKKFLEMLVLNESKFERMTVCMLMKSSFLLENVEICWIMYSVIYVFKVYVLSYRIYK
ncbi:hypothetical protein RDI58_010520 [Solanum bulbocastanum]|uniref:Uncharacterized protein n=1 Tax=Solanum bulbocastanum TaxID=147425 RepID=A0AAN8YFH1_SOLBU